MRGIKFALITLLALLVLAAGRQQQQVVAQGTNLLQNPDFEAGVYTFDPANYTWLALYPTQRESCRNSDQYLPCSTAQTPIGWIPWWISQITGDPEWKNRMPEYKPAGAPFLNRVHSGSFASQYFTFHSTHTAGLLQQVTVPANSRVRFQIWGQAWSSASDAEFSDYPTTVNMRIGIDPTGGSNPYNSAIVWSSFSQPYDLYAQFSVEAQAQGDKVTVFTFSAPDEARKHNDIYWDNAELIVVAGGVVPAATLPGGTPGVAEPPSAPNAATPTPNAAGLIQVVAQAGDSYWSIAANHGLTIAEILTLNNATETDFVQPGQLITIGTAEPPTPTPEPTLEPTAAPEKEATATPLPTEETALPTVAATATPAGGQLCLEAFDDANQNGLRDEDEARRAAIAFTVYNGEEVITNYVTDGQNEPYCISNLPAGNYRITRSTAPYETLTTSGDWTVNLSEGGTVALSFGGYLTTAEEEIANLPAATAEAPTPTTAETTEETAAEGGMVRIVVIVAVAIAVLIFVGVLVVILASRRSTV